MGIFNKVVNILVLVFAIAGVTFSYLLFNKREQLVAGWEEMSQSIAQTAKALEQNSGLKLSAKLSADTLGHKNPDNADLSGLKRNLPELSKAAKQIAAQRDSLAKSLTQTANMLEVRNISAAELQNLTTTDAKQKALLSAAKKVADRNNTIINNYAGSANKVIHTSVQALKANPGAVSNNFNRAIDDLKNRRSAYEKALNDIARTVGAPAPNYRGNYQDGVKKLIAAAQKIRNDLNRTRNELNQERAKTRNLTNQVRNRDNTIRSKDAEIRKLNAEIRRLRLIINPDGGPVEPDEVALYSRIEGKVETVNDRWGFVVINLGEKMPVIEKFKKGDRTKYMLLAPGFPVTVARNLTGDKPEFVAKLTIAQVGENYAIANIDKESAQSAVMVGDAVYFTKEDIAALLKIKDALIKNAGKK